MMAPLAGADGDPKASTINVKKTSVADPLGGVTREFGSAQYQR
jgi:hypothetical protein